MTMMEIRDISLEYQKKRNFMFRSNFDPYKSSRLPWIWFLLCFQAGAINAGGFLAVSRFVSHLTGFATLLGVEVGKGNLSSALTVATAPFYFLLGTIFSALLIDRRIRQKTKPLYAEVMFVIFALLLCVSWIEKEHFAKNLDMMISSVETVETYLIIVLLTFLCGIQNAIFSDTSGAVIRSTHLTGITTDLGVSIVRALSESSGSLEKKNEIRFIFFRMWAIFGFILGSALSSFVFLKNGYLGFLLPALVAVFLSGAFWYMQKYEKKTKS